MSTIVAATRTPVSPIQKFAAAFCAAGVNAPLIIEFHAACAMMHGQILPVPSRIQARIEPNAKVATKSPAAESNSEGPTAYTPANKTGRCQAPQMSEVSSMG